MALRAAASTGLTTTVVPAIGSFTIYGWHKVESDAGSSNLQAVATITRAGAPLDTAVVWESGTSGTPGTAAVVSFDGTNLNVASLASRPAVGQWAFWYMRCSGTGAGLLQVGWRRPQDRAWVTQSTTLAASASFTAATVYIPQVSAGGSLSDSSSAHWTLSRTVLTDTELQALMDVPGKMPRGGRIGYWPLLGSSLGQASIDYSGANVTLSAAGAPTANTLGPPLRPARKAVKRKTLGLINVGGAASHPSTGALSASAATIAGTAVHLKLHPTSGALAASAATVAGTAAHLTLHGTTGALAASSAAIAGTAAHQHTTTGALAAAAASMAGTAAHLTLHTTSGALVASAAAIAGTAVRPHAATGALAAGAAAIAGTALHPHVASGALAAQAAAISGAALHPHTTSGALAAQAAQIAGTALHPHTTSGALAARSAAVAGAADHITAGAGHASSGALAADVATVAGTAAHRTLHTTSGALAASAATVAGAAAHQHAATGALAASAAALAGTAAHLALHTTSGALAAQAATLAGVAAHNHSATGALVSGAATISGAAAHSAAGTHAATGALVADAAQVSGIATLLAISRPIISASGGGQQQRAREAMARLLEQQFAGREFAIQTAIALVVAGVLDD